MARRKPVDDGPSLFDLVDDEDAQPSAPEFRLAPHGTFLAWPDAMQLKHCADRDRESAADPETTEVDRAWYLQRAAAYEEMARG